MFIRRKVNRSFALLFYFNRSYFVSFVYSRVLVHITKIKATSKKNVLHYTDMKLLHKSE